ncbi:MAG: glucose-6-phosphate dehydrogenase [Planctomycetota bacterium]|jgi:glucose-6-phosphate 1-dehydrogenase
MSHTIVIFGASGDLTSRKLVPALYRQFLRGRLPKPSRIVGVARSAFTTEQWRSQLGESTAKYVKGEFNAEAWGAFAQNIFYCPGDIANESDFQTLASFLQQIEEGKPSDRVYYLSTMPQLYATAIEQLGRAGLNNDPLGHRRVVIEKPFGTDLASARSLNESIHQTFREDQIYRIDHYLGKETVQNILVLRFGNTIFEPLWNRNYIEHVQITVAEEVKVGRRGDYYDKAGVLRDMFQNHLFQLMMVTAMEAPVRYTGEFVRDEKVKVLQAIRPYRGSDFAEFGVRGQYLGYNQEEGVPKDSQTETFAALKLYIDNWRWRGVPFYLRSGKAMSCRSTQIVIQFREPPHLLFGEQKSYRPEANRLVIQIQPGEGVQIFFQSKVPDSDMRLRLSELDFRFDSSGKEPPDAYQRLLLDAMLGDPGLFARSDEVEQSWQIIDPIITAWKSPAAPALNIYEPGMWGPTQCGEWMQGQGRSWFDTCPILPIG